MQLPFISEDRLHHQELEDAPCREFAQKKGQFI